MDEEDGEEYCSDSFESIDSLRRVQHQQQKHGEIGSLPQLRTLSGESADDKRKKKGATQELGSGKQRHVKIRKGTGAGNSIMDGVKSRLSKLEQDSVVNKMTLL